MQRLVFLIISVVLDCHICFAQLQIPELSPAGKVFQKVGFTAIEVYYERPAARGRSTAEIFGKLVPFGKVWRTGAGNCTTISFSTDVWIGDKLVEKGKYAIFTIPEKNNWTVILNRDTLAYGAYNYDEAKDVVRLSVPAKLTERFYESLTIDIDVIPNNARIYIAWLNTQISFDVITGVDKQIQAYISEKLLTHRSTNAADYEAAVLYYLWHGHNRSATMDLINTGISLKDDRVWYYWKVEELMKDKKWTEAKTAAQAGIAAIKNSAEPDERKKELISDFEKYLENISLAQKKN